MCAEAHWKLEVQLHSCVHAGVPETGKATFPNVHACTGKLSFWFLACTCTLASWSSRVHACQKQEDLVRMHALETGSLTSRCAYPSQEDGSAWHFWHAYHRFAITGLRLYKMKGNQ
uniref:Uncharacterized protein n=1 Tax=Micrurus lemniscatus lemniscatus TaxID=129467 RepID=A0A2D4JHK1_MICLE